ncbi:MAG: hypothetical protein IJT59_07290 [Desulfovibrionaceae bacterium]|nr:hypothetical protein [Desulfovibrionaceae bacterium]
MVKLRILVGLCRLHSWMVAVVLIMLLVLDSSGCYCSKLTKIGNLPDLFLQILGEVLQFNR